MHCSPGSAPSAAVPATVDGPDSRNGPGAKKESNMLGPAAAGGTTGMDGGALAGPAASSIALRTSSGRQKSSHSSTAATEGAMRPAIRAVQPRPRAAFGCGCCCPPAGAPAVSGREQAIQYHKQFQLYIPHS
eukprot:scaffold16651_cov135-Isochrysis_galbana.AAC.4